MRICKLSLFLSLALLFFTLAGCSGEETSADGSQNTTGTANGNDLSDAYIDPEWPRPDYSDFSLPGETGELVLYTAGSSTGAVMRPAVEIFKSLYPDVNVTYETVGEDEFDERIRAELPAGKGPDLILFVNRTIPDVYKTESTGLFEDLGGYFEADPEIDRADFVPGVMDGMLFRGQQFIVPLHYEVPLLVTSRALLDEVGVEDPSDFENLAEAARRYRDLHPEGTLFLDTGDTNPVYTNRQQLIRHAGIAFIDYQRGEVSCDEEKLREVMDLLKIYYDPDYVVGDYGSNDYKQYGDYITHGCLLRKECLFNDFDTGYSNFATVCKALEISGDEAAAFIPKDPYGGITANITEMAAIPNASKNKLNAWRLMKILLSDDIQSGRDESRRGLPYFWGGLPVREASLRKQVEYDVGYWGYDLDDEEDRAIFESYMNLCTSPNRARVLPNIWFRYITDELFPYIYGEKPWNDCYKSFLNTLELYASE